MVPKSFHQLEENKDGQIVALRLSLMFHNRFDCLAKSEIVQEVNGGTVGWLYWDICINMTDTL